MYVAIVAAKIKCPNVIDGVAQNAMMKPVYIGCLTMRYRKGVENSCSSGRRPVNRANT
jgi:hypothetical protein